MTFQSLPRTILLHAVLLIMIMNTIPAMAQTPEKEVEKAVERLRAAMVSADEKTLNAIVSSDLSYGHSSGKIEDKAAFIQSLTSGESNFLEIELKEQTVKVTGDVALVRHHLVASIQDKGKDPASIKIGVLLVWVKQKGNWLLVGRQAFKLP